MGVDDLLRVLVYHLSNDISVPPNEKQRVRVAMVLLFAVYTSSRPAKLVDAEASEKAKKGIKSLKWTTDQQDLWDASKNSDNQIQVVGTRRHPKALCYEDICPVVLWNPDDGGQPVVAMEVKLSNHKGVNRRPKP